MKKLTNDRVFIYSLNHPLSDEIKYIGKSVNLKNRYINHTNRKRLNKRKVSGKIACMCCYNQCG